MESEIHWETLISGGTLWARVHEPKGENPAETGPQRGSQKVREYFSHDAYGGAGGI